VERIEVMGRRVRRGRQLLDDLKEMMIPAIVRGSTGSLSVDYSRWKRLQTWCKTHYRMQNV